eukprot:CAMPEP_0184973692 /NCGR_PEP_ID=MMETSP1098-20130426/5359_1 /TAXON_ID=89044 /ORGANISM="Spumella elongata, Strain CCAP 955/1" /LENGTH=205 /DNA_ID=CAMNT_0027496159 /DNA_START=85 /DNA_END=702 /DNA_ORIENTATION=-
MSTFKFSSEGHELVLDKFCARQFNNEEYTGSQIWYPEDGFEMQVNQYFKAGGSKLVDGYAPFCKHVFVPNFCNMDCGYTEITPENKHLIESCYEARTEKELPVLVQYIDRNKFEAPKATHLDIILYSREQIIKENEAMGNEIPDTSAPWGIISVKGQLCDYELPMQPITIMRNCLGKEHGGSGVPLDFDKYAESVAFWKKYVALK